jgi:hypothetical protein
MTSLKTYASWKQRHADLSERVDGHHRDWVGAVVGFTDEVSRDCADVSVTGWARMARTHAINFEKAKLVGKIDREFSKFLRYWGQLDGAFASQITMRSQAGANTGSSRGAATNPLSK